MNTIISIDVLEVILIMKAKIKNLTITDYCSTDKRKIRFVKEITSDPLVCHFVSSVMDEWIEDSEGTDRLLVGPAYIMADDRKLIGFIRCASLDNDGIMNLHYGVHPDFRRMHYGTQILTESSKYIFENMKNVSAIELYIKQINKGSAKCAINANFTYDRSIPSRSDDCLVNVYTMKR